MKTKQVISKQRVSDHGEVFTSKREVNAMLDLVKQETERIDSRFLEPACGDGNFLSEILERKLTIVENRYKINKNEYDKYSLIALCSIYGVEILEDNVYDCRDRLYKIFEQFHNSNFNIIQDDNLVKTACFILSKNIIHGDALTLATAKDSTTPVIFSEWSFVGDKVKRRDFTFNELLTNQEMKSLPLFSDLDEDVFLPTPLKEYPLVHYLELGIDA